ncbi:MAG TPA: hypothetical protein VMW83_02510 [Spirochaetia bacterium]|nr:hypothetical protein [Spirochaetia bacterium]
MDIGKDALTRYLVDILENIDNKRRVVLKFTAARQKGCGRLRVVRVTGCGDGPLILTVAVEGKGGG